MDFRTSRPAERPVASRPEPTHIQPEEPQPKRETPTTVQRLGSSHNASKEEKSKKRFLPIIIAIIVILLGLGAWFALSKTQATGAGIDNGKYQAVFFTNGQVYFGKLQGFNDEYLKLTDIFYLQTQATEEADKEDSKNPQETTTDQNNVQLIKLGQEVHGPEDAMIISKQQVLFYENLKTDSKVAQSISDYKKQ